VEANHLAKAAAQPANRKGVLAGREEDIARLYAGGKGRRISSIARTYRVSTTAIRKCLNLSRKPRGGRGRARSWCDFCGSPILVQAGVTRMVCKTCSHQAAEVLTIWRAGDPIEALPTNLRPYLQG
jgi:hypothetical protein